MTECEARRFEAAASHRKSPPVSSAYEGVCSRRRDAIQIVGHDYELVLSENMTLATEIFAAGGKKHVNRYRVVASGGASDGGR